MKASWEKIFKICTESNGVPISADKISELSGVSSRQVARVIKKLIEDKKLTRYRANNYGPYSYQNPERNPENESKKSKKINETGKRDSQGPNGSSLEQLPRPKTNSDMEDSRVRCIEDTSGGAAEGEYPASGFEAFDGPIIREEDYAAVNEHSQADCRRGWFAKSHSLRQIWFREIKRCYHPRRANDSSWKAQKAFDTIMYEAARGMTREDDIIHRQERVVIKITSYITRLSTTDRWKKDNGRYLPGFGNFLASRVWEDPQSESTFSEDSKIKVSKAHQNLKDLF